MSRNNESGALDYHTRTSHERLSLGGHSLDWGNQPEVFKRYPSELGLDAHPLSEPDDFPALSLEQLLEAPPGGEAVSPLAEATLSRVLVQACGVTASSRSPRGDFHYRSAASAGALYPVELYCALPSPVHGALPGLHHYNPLDHLLTHLGRVDALQDIASACGRQEPAAAAFVLTSIFFRSSWKYRARAYRYCLLDCGHVLENLLLALRAEGVGVRQYLDFDDALLNGLLGLDTALEVVLAVLLVEGEAAASPPRPQGCEPAVAELTPASHVSPGERGYEEIASMHRAGIYVKPVKDVAASPEWEGIMGRAIDFKPPLPEFMASAQGVTGLAPPLAECLIRRRSRRNFVPHPLDETGAAVLLRSLCARDPEGEAVRAPAGVCQVALSVQGVQSAGRNGLHDGIHLLRHTDAALSLLHAGSRQQSLAAICLGQEWLKNAAALCLFVADLAALERKYGPRAYRYAMLEAGRLGERVYLAAASLGLGACGIGAFFDNEAAMLLGVEHKAQLLYLVAFGPVRR